MISYAFDVYGERCSEAALKALLGMRDELTGPISWIKLQQGGQGDIAVSHVTVNHGIGRDRSPMLEVSLELDVDGAFPCHIDETSDDDDGALTSLRAAYELDENEAWETPESILRHELLAACSRIREGLRTAGIAIAEECVLCCGDEDNTWGWRPGRPFDEDTSLTAKDFEELGTADPTHFVELVYAGQIKRDWLRAMLTAKS